MVRQFLPFHFLFFSIVHNVKKSKNIPVMKRITYRMFQRVFIMASLSAIYVRVRSKIFFFGGFPVFLVINPRQQKLDETRTTTTYFLTVKRA